MTLTFFLCKTIFLTKPSSSYKSNSISVLEEAMRGTEYHWSNVTFSTKILVSKVRVFYIVCHFLSSGHISVLQFYTLKHISNLHGTDYCRNLIEAIFFNYTDSYIYNKPQVWPLSCALKYKTTKKNINLTVLDQFGLFVIN